MITLESLSADAITELKVNFIHVLDYGYMQLTEYGADTLRHHNTRRTHSKSEPWQCLSDG
jgi:hypothetical protein